MGLFKSHRKLFIRDLCILFSNALRTKQVKLRLQRQAEVVRVVNVIWVVGVVRMAEVVMVV